MATREALEIALRNAHVAGDAAAARRFADAIKSGQYENNEGDRVSEGPSPGTQAYVDKVRSDFDKLGFINKLGQATDDTARIVADSLSFGYADKLAGAMGDGVEKERRRTEDARIRAGSAGVVADLGSQIAGFSKLPLAAQAVNKVIPAAVRTGRGAISGTVGGAAEGAAYGAADAAGHDKDIAEGAKEGAAFGVLGQGAASLVNKGLTKAGAAFDGVRHMFDPNAPKRNASGTGKYDDMIADLEANKNKYYKEATDKGVVFTPSASSSVFNDVVGVANNFRGGYTPEVSPKVHATISQINRMFGDVTPTGHSFKPVPLQTVEDARAIIRDNLIGPKADPLDAAFGSQMLKKFDDSVQGILANPTPNTVRSNAGVDPSDAADILKQARDYNSRMRKMEQIDEALGGAERRSSRSIMTDEGTTIRSNIDSILSNKAKRRGFTKDELAAMDEIVRGSPTINVGSQLGRMMPGGSMSVYSAGLGGALGAALSGTAGGAAVGALIPQAVGTFGKKVAESAVNKKSDELVRLIASGGNKANIPKPDTALTPEMQDYLARYMMVYSAE